MSPRTTRRHGQPGAGTWELSAQSASKRELPGKGGSLGLDHANVLCADHLLSNLKQKFGLYLAERLCNQAPVKAWGAEALTGDSSAPVPLHFQRCVSPRAEESSREPARVSRPLCLRLSYCTIGVNLRWACHHKVSPAVLRANHCTWVALGTPDPNLSKIEFMDNSCPRP